MTHTFTEEEMQALKRAFTFILISHKAYFDSNVLFRAMKDSGDFEKVVAEPLIKILQWTPEDDTEKERVRKVLIEKAQEGRTPEEWHKSAKKALDKEFKITGKDIVTGATVALGIGATLLLGAKAIKALSNNGKGKKKTGE